VGCVYVGKGSGDQNFKIGRTGELENTRRQQHRTANPSFEYHLVIRTEFASEVEKRLHDHFGSKRIEGTKEWFGLTPDDLDSIKPLSEKYENELIPLSMKVDELGKSKSSGIVLEASDFFIADYKRLKELREQRARIQEEEEFLQLKLKHQIGLHDGIENLISWKSSEQSRFDTTLFRETHSDLYEEFRKPLIIRSFRIL
jgi:Meiotically up-regulated gene 113